MILTAGIFIVCILGILIWRSRQPQIFASREKGSILLLVSILALSLALGDSWSNGFSALSVTCLLVCAVTASVYIYSGLSKS
jgi:hypothetical protein